MNICFTVKDIKELSEWSEYKKISPDPENFSRCVSRERYYEYLACPSEKRIVYERNTGMFHYAQTLDLYEKILVRDGEPAAGEAKQAIIARGWTPLTYPYEDRAVRDWLRYVPKKYIKRQYDFYHSSEFHENQKEIIKRFSDEKDRFFMKTVRKHWAKSGTFDEMLERDPYFLIAPEELMIGEYQEIETDKYGSIEYRTFVINGKAVGISRYLDYDYPEPHKEAIKFTQEIIQKCCGKIMPNSLTIDVALREDGEWILVEMNPISSSGRYCGIPARLGI